MNIEKNLTNVNYNYRGSKPSWIVIHNTANGTSASGTAYNNTCYFKSTYHAASAHYFIDDGDTIWQCVEDTNTAWHCGESASRNGCYNTNSIGIEVCEPSEGEYTQKEKDTLRELVLYLMDKYEIPASRVCRHNDVTGKNCPWFYAASTSAWNSLKAYITTGSAPVKTWYDMIVYGSNGGNNQKWIIHEQEDNSVIFESVAHRGFALDVSGSNTANGTAVGLYKMHGNPNQRWFIDGDHIVSALDSDKCLDVTGAYDKPSTKIELYKRNDSDAQKWAFLVGSDGYTTIVNNHRNKKLVLDVQGG